MIPLAEYLSRQPRQIAYLGNSVTAQRDGYRPLLTEILRNRTGQKHQEINASLGGVGSLISTCLVEWLALRHRPDVCLIELSVADRGGATPESWIEPSIGSLVARLRTHGVMPVLLHLPRNDAFQVRAEAVIDHYQSVAISTRIPVVDVRDLTGEVLAHDGIHTSANGARELAALIAELVLEAEVDVHWDGLDTCMLDLTRAGVHVPETVRPSSDSVRGTVLPERVLGIGDSVTQSESTEDILGALMVVDSTSGVVRITGSNTIKHFQTFDQWCDRPRLQGVLWPGLFSDSGTIRMEMTDLSRAPLRADGQPTDLEHMGSTCRFLGWLTTGQSLEAHQWWR